MGKEKPRKKEMSCCEIVLSIFVRWKSAGENSSAAKPFIILFTETYQMIMKVNSLYT